MRDLVARLQARDQTALAELYDSMSRRAFGLAMRVTGDEATAADVVQEAFVWIWERAERLDAARGRPEGLLLTIVHRRAIDAARHRQRLAARTRPVEDADLLPNADNDPPPLLHEQQYEAIRASFRTLPAEQRDVLEQVYFQGLTQLEVAERSGAPLGTVKSRLRLGLQKLRASVMAAHR